MDEKRPKWNGYIYFAVLSTSLVSFATGTCYTWTSPILPKFEDANSTVNPIGRPITIFESALIVSIMGLGLMVGPPISILCANFFSKKSILLLVSLPLVIAHLIGIFANKVEFFFIIRFLMGISSGSIWSVLPNFVAEISEDRNRGILGGLTGVMYCAGCLFNYSVGPFVSIRIFSIVNLVPLILYYTLYGIFVPDSPYDLIIKNNSTKAEESLIKLRKNSKVQKELVYISNSIKASSNDKNFKDIFRDKGSFKAFRISFTIMVFQQLSGTLAVSSYTQTIFESAGSAIPAEFSAIIAGSVALLSISISSQLIDIMGRKVLLALSCIIVSISLFILGGYFYVQNSGADLSKISWLPIASVMAFMFSYNFGLMILPWVILGELFSSNVKVAASTILSMTNFFLSFIVTLCFPYLVELITMSGTFFIFASFMVLASIFMVVFLPETKGKSFQEIQKILSD